MATKVNNTAGLRRGRTITKTNAKEIGRKGGYARAKAIKERRTLREALRELLAEEYRKGSGVSWLAAICQQALRKAANHGDVRDLKVLAELLGEMQTDNIVQASQVLNIQTSEGGKELITAIIKGDGSDGIQDDKGV